MKKILSITVALLMLINVFPVGALASSAEAVMSPQKLEVDGKEIECEKYNIGGNNYFKLRDIAQILSETSSRFEVGYDSGSNTIMITTGKSYTTVGGELEQRGDLSAKAVKSSQTVQIDGEKVSSVSVYNIGGNNFFKLRDLGDFLKFFTDYDSTSNAAKIYSLGNIPLSLKNISYVGKSKIGDVYKIAADPSRGYVINAYVSIPKTVKLKHMLVNPTKIGKQQAYELTDAQVQELVLSGHSHFADIGKPLGAICLNLSLPETNMRDGFRHLELDATVLSGNDQYKDIDQQVCRIIDDARRFLFSKALFVPGKVDMAGYSGEGDFIVRFSLLHPDKLWAACAGGISWSPSLPKESIRGENLKYPLGIYDISKYSSDFDLDAWKQIHFYVDMGLLDDHGSYNHKELSELVWARNMTYPEVWDVFCDSFADLTKNVELVTYLHSGHKEMKDDYIAFLEKNDTQTFVSIQPATEANVKLGK